MILRPFTVLSKVYPFHGIPEASLADYSRAVATSPHDQHACEIRYRDVLGRLEDLSSRVERLERDQRTFVDLLRDLWELIRLVMTRLKASDPRPEPIAVRLIPVWGLGRRIARHFRN